LLEAGSCRGVGFAPRLLLRAAAAAFVRFLAAGARFPAASPSLLAPKGAPAGPPAKSGLTHAAPGER
jgi:hypothetical protein